MNIKDINNAEAADPLYDSDTGDSNSYVCSDAPECECGCSCRGVHSYSPRNPLRQPRLAHTTSENSQSEVSSKSPLKRFGKAACRASPSLAEVSSKSPLKPLPESIGGNGSVKLDPVEPSDSNDTVVLPGDDDGDGFAEEKGLEAEKDGGGEGSSDTVVLFYDGDE